jgi:hypothetical protein
MGKEEMGEERNRVRGAITERELCNIYNFF